MASRRPSIFGVENIDLDKPAVFVSNHLGSFGPMVLNVHLPFKLIPWVTHEITDKKLCPDYIEKDFVTPEMRLRPPLSRLVAFVFGRICVSLMDSIRAIPVYKRNRKVVVTIDRSVKELGEGRHILVFPEIHEFGSGIGEPVEDFKTGFIGVARKLWAQYRLAVIFYPVAVNKMANTIRIGKGVAYEPANSYAREKQRIVNYLHESVLHLYGGEPPAGAGPGTAATAVK